MALPPAKLPNEAPAPASGSYADGFGRLAKRFASHLRRGTEVGAAVCVVQRGQCVVDLWGGLADAETRRPWTEDTRIVVFSATKGLAAMALNMLADRGKLDWSAPVATYWPAFAAAGKERVTVRTLFNHRAGLLALDAPLTLDDCMRSDRAAVVQRGLEEQRPAWEPGSRQAYHALSFGLYASELFHRIAGESIGTFLRRELLEPAGSDARLGTPSSEDSNVARLYVPAARERIRNIALDALRGGSTETRVTRELLRRHSLTRRAFSNPRGGHGGAAEYNAVPARRAELAWASATSSARGLARAYLPFASAGRFDGREYIRASALELIYGRQSWSERDGVLQKPIGWSQGFVKEDAHVFSPNPEAFGHPGMGGALGWCDPVREIALGYVMNRMDWRVRSPRALALCHALYACEPVRGR
jgi:CubicO group peptidase (beta-lactamase class C family)